MKVIIKYKNELLVLVIIMKNCPVCGNQLSNTAKKCKICDHSFGVYNHLPPGTLIGGRYSVGKKLSQGNFSLNYLGSERKLNRLVFIKEFFIEGSDRDNETVVPSALIKTSDYENFLQEVRDEFEAIKAVKSPFLPKMYDYIEANNTAYIVMEYIEGRTLVDKFEKEGKFNDNESKQIALDITSCISCLHKNKYVHYEIDPKNIICDEYGNIVLTGFSSAKYHFARRMNRLDIWSNTMFCAPEMLKLENKCGPEIDSYALGKLLLYIFTCNKSDLSGDHFGFNKDLNLPDGMNERLREIIVKCMETNPSKRYKNAVEIEEALTKCLFPKVKIGSNYMKLETEETEKVLLTGHDGPINTIAVSPNGKYIVSGSCDKTIKIWDMLTGKELNTLTNHNDWINSIVISKDGRFIVSGSDDGIVRVWDLFTGKAMQVVMKRFNEVLSVSISVDNRSVAFGCADGSVFLNDIARKRILRIFKEHSDSVNSVIITENNRYLISASDDGRIIVRDLFIEKTMHILNLDGKPVYTLSASPNSKFLVSGHYEGKIIIWDLKTGKQLKMLTGHNLRVNSISLNYEKGLIVSGSYDRTVKLWSFSTAKELQTFTNHKDTGRAVSISSNGKHIVSGSNDGSIMIWTLVTTETNNM